MKKQIKVKAIEKARNKAGQLIEGANWKAVRIIDSNNEEYGTLDYKLPQDLVQAFNAGQLNIDCEIDYDYNEKYRKNDIKTIKVIKEVPNVLPVKENITTVQLNFKLGVLEAKIDELLIHVKGLVVVNNTKIKDEFNKVDVSTPKDIDISNIF